MSRFIFPKQSSAIWFLVAAILCLAAALLAYPGKAGLVREAQLAGIRKGEGFLLTAPYPPEMKKSYGRVFLPQDDLVVLEDGEALPVLAPGKKDIELAGWGRFRAGSEEILFSTSDGNELDGRIYRIRWPAWSVREWIPGILFLLGFAAFGVGAAQLQPLSRRLASGLGAALSLDLSRLACSCSRSGLRMGFLQVSACHWHGVCLSLCLQTGEGPDGFYF